MCLVTSEFTEYAQVVHELLLLPDYVFYALAYGIGILVFVAAYFVRKRSGLALALTFREIPPE